MSTKLFQFILLSLVILIGIDVNAQRIICDETCKLADAPAGTVSVSVNQNPEYAVVSPVGQSSVEMISQAPRLETLEGKTIAVVGVFGILIYGNTHSTCRSIS